ncbi:MAG: M56 family metallopeptidase [Vicinamibacterales bacterium]
MSAALLIQFLLKGACVLLATWAATLGMRKASAASRHLVWTLGVLATLALPLVRVVGPSWDVAVPASIPETEWFAVPATTVESAPPQPVQETAVLLPQAPPETSVPVAASSVEATPAGTEVPGSGALVAIWLLGAGILALRLVYGFARAARIARRGTDVEDDGWLEAFDEAAAALQVDRRVALKVSDETSVPVACGLLRPAVLLPREALAWPGERRRVVLLHELAHVRRRDCLVQGVGQLARALHWMNPLAHIALARLRAEQERACDDLVLSTGTAAPTYADHLFEIARAFRTPAAPAWATLAMARPSQLEGRLMAILDERCNRAPAGRRVRAVLGVTAITAIVLLGALHITAESPVARALVAGSDVRLPFSADPAPQPAPEPEPAAEAQSTPATPATPAAPATQSSEVTDETRRRVADALATALDDQNLEVRKRAIEGLVSMRDARAVPALLRASRDANADLRELAINGLTRFDTPESRAAVAAGLKDASAGVRERAAVAVGRTRDAAAVPSLLPLLKDPQARVRERAALALGMIGDSSAIDGLTAALKDTDARVRENAASALATIARGERRGPRPAVPIPPMPPVRIGANGVPENLKEITEFARDMALRFDGPAFKADMKRMEEQIEAEVEAAVDAARDSLR